MIKISIIIPVRNDARRLQKCLASLRNQTVDSSKFEILVIDYKSTDDLPSLKKEYTEVKFLEVKKPGVAAARNEGVKNATGEMIAFIDADCIAKPDWLEKGMEYLRNNTSVGLIGGNVQCTFATPGKPTIMERYFAILHFRQKTFIDIFHFSVTANMFTFASVFSQIGLFDEDAFTSYGGEDLDWGNRVYDAGLSLEYKDDVVVYHPAEKSLLTWIKKRRQIKKTSIIFRKKNLEPRQWFFQRVISKKSSLPILLTHSLSKGPLVKLQLLCIYCIERLCCLYV